MKPNGLSMETVISVARPGIFLSEIIQFDLVDVLKNRFKKRNYVQTILNSNQTNQILNQNNLINLN